ncbi:MAG: ParB/RepB/Spo0J family partition protein [Chloroflexota bacterium]
MAKRARITSDQAKTVAKPPDEIAAILNLENVEQLPVSMIPIETIDPNPFQPRQLFDPERISELSTAIQANGFLGSLVAREVEGRYQLAFGERRLRAAKQAQISRIPLHISPFSDEQMAEVAITENVNREDLTAIEEAMGYQVLNERFGYSYRDIAQRVGKSSSHIGRMFSLLEYEEIKDAVAENRITVTAAAELVTVKDEAERKRLLKQVAARQLGRDALRAAVKMANEKKPEPPPSDSASMSDFSTPQQSPIEVYDPIPKLYAALNNIKRVQRHRLNDVIDSKRGDAREILRELKFLLDEIENNL